MADSLTWLLTSTTYGTWLPGDARGFVGRVREIRHGDDFASERVEHDRPGTEYDAGIPKLREASISLMKGEPVWLTADLAIVVRDQFIETAAYRGWELHAASVMSNHFHLVVTAKAEILTDAMLRDFKAYASRALNCRRPKPASGTWWTSSGSRRRLPDDRALDAAIAYVLNQHSPLAVYPEPSGGRQPPVSCLARAGEKHGGLTPPAR
ncbi:MAG: transposase [Gemmataceae bacterium]